MFKWKMDSFGEDALISYIATCLSSASIFVKTKNINATDCGFQIKLEWYNLVL